MLDCNYFNKYDVPGFKKMVSKLYPHDSKIIAEKLSLHIVQIQKYISTDKKHAKVRIPQLFIDAVIEIVNERKENIDKITQELKEI